MNRILLANLFSVVSIVLNYISTQFNEKNKVLIYNTCLNIICIIQYYLLGAYTGAITCFVALLRNLVFALYKKKIPFIYLLLYFVLIIACDYPFVKTWIDILPIFLACLYGFALYQSNGKVLRFLTLIVDSTGGIYDLYNKAYVSFINCMIASIGSIRKMIVDKRNSKKKRGKRRKKKVNKK